jgi:hypothetical protein
VSDPVLSVRATVSHADSSNSASVL